VTHIDVKSLELVIGALEVPGRIGAARPHDEVTASKHLVELAPVGENRVGKDCGCGQSDKADTKRRCHGVPLVNILLLSNIPDMCLFYWISIGSGIGDELSSRIAKKAATLKVDCFLGSAAFRLSR